MSWGFTATTTSAAPWTASAFEVVASTPWRSCSSAARSSRRLVTTMSRQPELSRPESSASPMRPAADDRDPPLRHARSLPMRRALADGQQPARVAGEQVDAREPGPFAVRLEQLVRLPASTAAPQRARQLDEAEVADEPAVVAAEAVEATTPTDHGPSPRSRSSRAATAPSGRRAAARARSCDRGGRASRRGGCAARARAAAPARAPERGRRRRDVKKLGDGALTRADDRRSMRRARFASISWPQKARSSACATVGEAHRPQAAQRRDASPSSGSSRTRRRNSEWSSSSARSTAAAPRRPPTRPGSSRCRRRLPGARKLGRPSASRQAVEHPVAERPRRVARQPRGETRARTARAV